MVARNFRKSKKNDVMDITEEIMHLKSIHTSCFGGDLLKPIDLLNKLYECGFAPLYPNVAILLRIFCSMTVTVASGERSFSKLAIIESEKRATMIQERLNGVAMLSIESDLARSLNYDDIINAFASERARKVKL